MTLSATAIILLGLLVLGAAACAWGIRDHERGEQDEHIERINRIDAEARNRRRASEDSK